MKAWDPFGTVENGEFLLNLPDVFAPNFLPSSRRARPTSKNKGCADFLRGLRNSGAVSESDRNRRRVQVIFGLTPSLDDSIIIIAGTESKIWVSSLVRSHRAFGTPKMDYYNVL